MNSGKQTQNNQSVDFLQANLSHSSHMSNINSQNNSKSYAQLGNKDRVSKIDNLLISSTSTNNNMNQMYSELARQLKVNKSTSVRNNKPINHTADNMNEIISNKSGNNMFSMNLLKSYNKSFSQLDMNNIEHKEREKERIYSGIERGRSESLLSSMGLTKTTKDSSLNGTKIAHVSNILSKANEIDSPEELHYFYVTILQQNKKLAYKFEKNCISNDLLGEEI